MPAVGLADLRLEERLRYFMVGGAEGGTVGSQRGVAAAAGRTTNPGKHAHVPMSDTCGADCRVRAALACHTHNQRFTVHPDRA